jgi:hypothetical protein
MLPGQVPTDMPSKPKRKSTPSLRATKSYLLKAHPNEVQLAKTIHTNHPAGSTAVVGVGTYSLVGVLSKKMFGNVYNAGQNTLTVHQKRHTEWLLGKTTTETTYNVDTSTTSGRRLAGKLNLAETLGSGAVSPRGYLVGSLVRFGIKTVAGVAAAGEFNNFMHGLPDEVSTEKSTNYDKDDEKSPS